MDPIVAAKKSKRTVTIILVITALLAIASVVTGYYFLQINDVAPKDSNASDGCACYYVSTTDKITSCSDATTKDAFEFQTGTVQSDDSCSASCDLRTASQLVTAAKSVVACKVNDFPINPGCIDVSIEDKNQKRYANEVTQGQELVLKAKFAIPSNESLPDTFYKSFAFLVNGVRSDVAIDQATTTGENSEKIYTISKTINDYSSADALTVQALGISSTGDQLTSEACNRTLAITKPLAPTCTELKAEIVNEGKVPKVAEITVTTSSITSPSSLSVKFTVGDSNQVLTTKNVVSKLTNGSLVFSKTFLYDSSNFVENKSFAILDNQKQDINISSQVFVDGKSITSGSCSGDFEIPEVVDEPSKDPTDVDNGTDNPPVDDNNGEEPTDTPTDTTDTSNFSVTKSASLSCVERTAPSNTVRYTITITNNDTESEKVVRIEDKLPLGFDYVLASTIINGSSQSDTGLVEITNTGSTQQVTFEKTGGWSIAAGGTLTIRFTAQAGSDALSGGNLNEVVVVPENNPVSSASVRTSVSVTVAQSCTAPETGLFDTTISKVILAIVIIVLGTFFYFSQSGLDISERLVYSPLGMFVRKINLKASNPKQYFEEKVVEKLEKEKKS